MMDGRYVEHKFEKLDIYNLATMKRKKTSDIRHPTSDLVSIVIPVKSINHYIREAVPYLLTLDYPNFEIIVVTDKLEKSPWPEVKIVVSGAVGPAQKRDLGEKKATGEYIALIDDDAYPQKDWLKKALPHFANEKVAAVCGPGVTPPHTNFLEKLSGIVSHSKLCWGNVTFRNQPEGRAREVDDYITANLIVRQSDYQAVGGFGTAYWPGEDTSFCLNIIEKLGKKIIYDPTVVVFHHRRPFGLPYLKQVAGYGLHRGYFAKILPKTSFRLPYFVPSLFVVGVLGGLGMVFLKMEKFVLAYTAILGIYGLLLILEFAKTLAKHKNFWLACLTPPAIFSVHLVYGARFLQGFLLTQNLISKLRR
ncbi:MAG: glycosyltransferase [bacterium]